MLDYEKSACRKEGCLDWSEQAHGDLAVAMMDEGLSSCPLRKMMMGRLVSAVVAAAAEENREKKW